MLGTAQDGDRGRRLRKDVQQPPLLRLLDAADASAQQLRFDARDQLARRKRLDDVVVRPGLQSFDSRFFAGASRQHHHGHFTGRRRVREAGEAARSRRARAS